MFRIGIIGAANIAHHFVDSSKQVPEVRIVAVASKSMERAAAFAEKENIPAAYDSYEEMLVKEAPDAVYVATTMNFHYENTMLALKHHVPVLCEKALTDTAQHARELFQYAKEQNTFLMEGIWSLFTPKTEKVREWVLDGRIGEVNLIQGNIGFVPEKNPENRFYSHALGGGAALDLGTYMIELPPYLVGQEIRDFSGWTEWGYNDIDEKIVLNMKLDHAVCNIIGSFNTTLPEECLIAGDRGYIRLPHYHSGKQAFLYNASGELAEEYNDTESVGFEYEIEEMIRCIRAGKITSETASPELSIRCAEICDRFRNK